ncbi:hypothetical protein, partial [Bacillus cereus group sp. Bce020]|uniref:hypothetical protein n=1 Tax=Bacillus cereus group sp. Bce020 TaxID=3445246 RepID=UPI003F21AE71
YINSKTNIKIICPQHGVFEQEAGHHMYGGGCIKCGYEKVSKNMSENSTGWGVTKWEEKAMESKVFDSFKVYIIKCWNDNESFYKIG